MALLASGTASTGLFSCPSCARTPKRGILKARCSVSPDGEEFVKEVAEERVPRRTALLRAGYGAGMVAVSGILGAGVGECAVESKKLAREGEVRAKFYELEGSSGVKALDIRQGMGASPEDGDKVEVHYYGRLGAKQGWRFDSTYDHKDFFGNPEPYVFTVGDENVIGGINSAVRSMKEGGVRRVVIPPSQGYQNTSQGPIPPDYFDRQRLYTTIFNQTRLANGEGDTLGTLIFDIELLKVRKPQLQ